MARKQVRSKLSPETGAAPAPVTRTRHRAKPAPAAEEHAPEAAAPQTADEHEEIARLAYSYWEARGCTGGSAEEDWLRAEREYRARRDEKLRFSDIS
jgi:hypothetical protein